jgi:SAM-dependent methyltransferase
MGHRSCKLLLSRPFCLPLLVSYLEVISLLVEGLLRRFVHINCSLSDLLVPAVIKTTHAYTRYSATGERLLELEPGTVLDVGAGKQWHFGAALKRPATTLIGFDIDMEEMVDNPLLDARVSGDACVSLGVPDSSVDLIMGRAVIEHLHDNTSFLENANRALREGGRLVVTFPNRYAPFAMLNRLLPRRVSQWLLRNLVPGSSGQLGFEAYYDRASYRDFANALQEAGFDIEEQYASYFSSWYFRFFFPMYLVGLGFDYACHLLKNPHFAAYFMVVAKKKQAIGS